MELAPPKQMNPVLYHLGELFLLAVCDWIAALAVLILGFMGLAWASAHVPMLHGVVVSLIATFSRHPEPLTFLLATLPAPVIGAIWAYIPYEKSKAPIRWMLLLAAGVYALLALVNLLGVVPENQMPSVDSVYISLVGVLSGTVGALFTRWLISDDDD